MASVAGSTMTARRLPAELRDCALPTASGLPARSAVARGDRTNDEQSVVHPRWRIGAKPPAARSPLPRLAPDHAGVVARRRRRRRHGFAGRHSAVAGVCPVGRRSAALRAVRGLRSVDGRRPLRVVADPFDRTGRDDLAAHRGERRRAGAAGNGPVLRVRDHAGAPLGAVPARLRARACRRAAEPRLASGADGVHQRRGADHCAHASCRR